MQAKEKRKRLKSTSWGRDIETRKQQINSPFVMSHDLRDDI
jgi:hypothetical protein